MESIKTILAVLMLGAIAMLSGCTSEKEQAASPYLVKDIEVVWQRYLKDEKTCDRCNLTGKGVEEIISELGSELSAFGVNITLTQKPLDKDKISESNMIFINNEAIEDLVDGVKVVMNDCGSCGDMAGSAGIKCRAIEYKGKVYNEVPQALIREAILVVAKNLPRPERKPVPEGEKKDSDCSG